MNLIKKNTAFPSAAFGLRRNSVRYYQEMDRIPECGDVIYGEVTHIGQHSNLENKSGRIHMIHNGSRGIFVFGSRYAPDHFEGVLPDAPVKQMDLLARSGIVGKMKTKNSAMKDPSRVKVLGYVCLKDGTVVNTRNYPAITVKTTVKKPKRAKLILVCGTAMNSGKSMAATACCWALTTLGRNVRASKVTGTASLKDILHMNDAGATYFSDFTYLGYPSTYLLKEEEVLDIFNKLDLKYANNPANYWVVEFADGINQRETAYLLNCEEVRSRIHRLVFCANDGFGAIGGLRVLKDTFGLVPDAISGVCSSSPLHVRELSQFTDIPVFNSFEANPEQLKKILL